MKRRSFIKRSSNGALLLLTGSAAFDRIPSHDLLNLTILHTNDMHSRVEAFPMDGSRNQGLGGLARRASLISKIKSQEEHVLLLDAGDIFQGTPYFNFFEGEVEMKAMSMMGYDAATIGNHDFDLGIDNLKEQMNVGNFPMINCNYDFSNTALAGQVHPFKVFHRGGVKIGVTGVGIELRSLVPKELYEETQYNEPVAKLNKTALHLKQDLQCDYVICLSHLGFKYREDKIDDIKMAGLTSNIDLIIGGHTHTFLNEPVIEKNKDGKAVVINQVGWAGIMLGRLDIQFEWNKKNTCTSCKNLFIGKI